MVGFGSSTYISISREQITEALTECIDAVHRTGGLAGIHICANGDWSLALESGTDIINFDAYSFFDRVILYRDHLKKFLLDGGILAWGIVPTSNPEWVDAASEEELFLMWQKQFEQMKSLGVDGKKILSQTLITPSCGTGTLSPDHATKVLSLTKALSEKNSLYISWLSRSQKGFPILLPKNKKIGSEKLTRQTRNPSTFHQILVFVSKDKDVRVLIKKVDSTS